VRPNLNGFELRAIRFFAVIRQTMKALSLIRCPQMWLKPKNVKVSGFSSPTLLSVSSGEPPELDQSCLVRM
jgi:hypothetical protein